MVTESDATSETDNHWVTLSHPALPSPAEVAALVKEAAVRLDGVARCTPLQRNERLSALTGAEVWLKREDLQPVRSYKLRGAYALMSQLTEAERAAGVVCASAGNHGQGVAWSCARLGISGQVFVPTTTPRQKRERIRELGGDCVQLVVTGETYDAAAEAAAAEAVRSGRVLVPAFDDRRTVAGQGTVAAEIVAQLGAAPDVVVVPVGGGGLIAGCASWLNRHAPNTRVVGVEPAGAASILAGLAAGHPVRLAQVDTFVDGAAVRRAGDVTLPLIAQLGFGPLDDGVGVRLPGDIDQAAVGELVDAVTVDTGQEGDSGAADPGIADAGGDQTLVVGAVPGSAVDINTSGVTGSGVSTMTGHDSYHQIMSIPEGQVCTEMLALYQTDGIIAEPAGALASAALRDGAHDVHLAVKPGQTVVVIVSGGNNDISRYNEVLERSLIHEGRKHYFMVSFPQEPGQLRRFLDQILGPDDDIVLFEYVKKSNRESGPALVGIELGDPTDLDALLARAAASPIQVERITPDSTLFRYLI